MPPKYITLSVIPAGAPMKEGVYRGTAEHNFISMLVPLIVISREIRLIGLVTWNVNTFAHNCTTAHSESSLPHLGGNLKMVSGDARKSYLSPVFYETTTLLGSSAIFTVSCEEGKIRPNVGYRSEHWETAARGCEISHSSKRDKTLKDAKVICKFNTGRGRREQTCSF